MQQSEESLAADEALATAMALSLSADTHLPPSHPELNALGPPPDDKALAALLSEALDDFDEDETPKAPPPASAKEVAARHAVSRAVSCEHCRAALLVGPREQQSQRAIFKVR